MLTIIAAVYGVVTIAFIAGLARAARRPVPVVDNIIVLSNDENHTQEEGKIIPLDRAA